MKPGEDVWVDITRMGDPIPRYMLAVSGRESLISYLRELYVHDRLSLEALEARIAEVLRAPGQPYLPDPTHLGLR